MVKDSLEKVLKNRKIRKKVIDLLMDISKEGIVLVDDEYKIIYMNSVLAREFGYSPNQIENLVNKFDKSYFTFFFGDVSTKERAGYPIVKAFKGEIKKPLDYEKLAKNNYYYDIVIYPVEDTKSETTPQLVMEIWSNFGSEKPSI